jgi:hypothetical protein
MLTHQQHQHAQPTQSRWEEEEPAVPHVALRKRAPEHWSDREPQP